MKWCHFVTYLSNNPHTNITMIAYVIRVTLR